MDRYNDLIYISYGKTGGDCTCPYYFTIKKSFSVKEFIELVLSDTREWGTIKIVSDDVIHNLEYKYGEIKTLNLPCKKILESPVKEIYGSGGWSRSDYTLYV